MENILKPSSIGILSIIFLGGFFFIFNDINSYSDKTTHPALTDEIVDFYNYFAKNKLTEEEKYWLKQGSIDEDIPIRYVNHFYDPIYNRTWVKIYLGYLISTSKVWGQSSTAQALYDPAQNFAGMFNPAADPEGLSSYDYSWDRAIYDYKKGNKQRAYYALGHILHLIEDATVPEHTRLDPHIETHLIIEPFTDPSPYEDFTRQFNDQNLNLAEMLFDKGYKPKILNTLSNYFDETANYSNRNFFSEDTIVSKEFVEPKFDNLILLSDGWSYGIKEDEELNDYHLVKLWSSRIEPFNFKEATVNDNQILSDYWERLSRKAILNGAGVIALFHKEANNRTLASLDIYRFKDAAGIFTDGWLV